jgi:hypothetical protein
VPIVASLRVISKPNNGSFSEILGLPRPQWSTTYSFPRYDNVNLNTQLRVANVGGSTTTVTVTVRGQEVDRFDIGSGKGVRRSIPNLNDGPIKVTSLGGVLIVASLRVALPTGPNTFTNFSEMMGLPESQLDNLYLFPWYTNTADLPMKLWLANPNDTPASVDVFLAGRRVPGSPFAVPAGKTIAKTFANANSGPLKVVEVGNKNILASLSVQFQAGGASYSEWMGLPESQLFTRYLFPWYTNNATTKTRLRVAVPDVP